MQTIIVDLTSLPAILPTGEQVTATVNFSPVGGIIPLQVSQLNTVTLTEGVKTLFVEIIRISGGVGVITGTNSSLAIPGALYALFNSGNAFNQPGGVFNPVLLTVHPPAEQTKCPNTNVIVVNVKDRHKKCCR
jgi:hypothetical protein